MAAPLLAAAMAGRGSYPPCGVIRLTNVHSAVHRPRFDNLCDDTVIFSFISEKRRDPWIILLIYNVHSFKCKLSVSVLSRHILMLLLM